MHSEKQPSLPSGNVPWNKGRLVGQKRPLKPKDVGAIRVRLHLEHRTRDLALFNLAIDSKLRGCDLVRVQVDDVCAGGRIRDRVTHTEADKKSCDVKQLTLPCQPKMLMSSQEHRLLC